MKIRSINEIEDAKNKTIILRVDYNVPLTDKGEISDDTRIVRTIETIKLLRDKGAKLVIISHLGRPKGEVKESLRLNKIAERLSELIGEKVEKLDESRGENVKEAISQMKEGAMIMLENIRFNKEEKECDKDFSKELASYGDIFVLDAFGAAHRAHSSISGISEHIPSYAGLLLEKEVNSLSPLLNEEPKRPLTMIFGGAKIDTKIGVIRQFLDKADYFLMGGALANTFLAAAGYNVAQSLYEEDKIEIAREIMLECEKCKDKFLIPHDVVVASEIGNDVETLDIPIEDVMGDMKILDIGKWTAEKYDNIIAQSGTVIWNGPVGLTEFKPFQNGTKVLAQTLSETDCTSILGGGDTVEAIKTIGIDENLFSHVSTGGGACIEFLSGEELPGVKAVQA